MPRRRHHRERHLTSRIGWLRAAVLGANDGVVSTASLIVGVAAAHASHQAIPAGVASLVAGAMSMAAGEYVSVSSQADMEEAETETERKNSRTTAPANCVSWRRFTSSAACRRSLPTTSPFS
jgi:VIT1/CCC1 family predicted Fe2+/Mn2+ transporter